MGGAACGGGDCFIPPCVAPFAAVVNIQSGVAGKALDGAFVRDSNSRNAVLCGFAATSISCRFAGGGGTYEFDIGATGFQTVHRTVTVTQHEPANGCGCTTVDTQTLNVVLTPSA